MLKLACTLDSANSSLCQNSFLATTPRSPRIPAFDFGPSLVRQVEAAYYREGMADVDEKVMGSP